MDLATTNLRSSFLPTSPLLAAAKSHSLRRPFLHSRRLRILLSLDKKSNPRTTPFKASASASVAETASADIESLFTSQSTDNKPSKKKSTNTAGAFTVSSGVRLENITKSFKGVTVLRDVTWEVKKGDKVGLVGVNGAGKTTHMRIIAGLEEPDSGNVIKAKENMKIAFLSQEFEVCGSRTVREEFLSAFKEEMEVAERLERVQKVLEGPWRI